MARASKIADRGPRGMRLVAIIFALSIALIALDDADACDGSGVKSAQVALYLMGFDPGPIDGKAGRQTLIAVERWQSKTHRPMTGRLGDAEASAIVEYYQQIPVRR